MTNYPGMESVRIYLDGKAIKWGVLEVKPKTVYSSGMPIVQNFYYLQGKEVFLDRVEKFLEVDETKIFLRSK